MQEVIEGFHLSPQQEHLWLLQGDHNVYRAYCSILLEGPLDICTLQASIEAVMEQNEIYRMCLRRLPGAKIPLQVVAERGLFTWQHIDLCLCHAQEQALKVKEVSEQQKQRPIDCEHGPLLHLSLITLSNHKHMLLVHTLALYADKRTLQLFMRKVALFYCQDHISDNLTDEIVQYIQFSAWQNSMLEEEIGTRGREWWRKKDLSALSTTSLPGEHKSDEPMPFLPEVLTFSLEHSLQKKLYEVVEHYKTSVDLLLFVCWKILLWRLTGQRELCVGLGVDERVYEELAETFGPLTKYVPLSYYLDENQSFADVLGQIGNTTEEASEWQQSFLWEDVMRAGEMTTVEAAFFPVSFDFHKLHSSCTSNNVSFELQAVYACQEPFKINLSAVQKEHDLTMEFHYDANLFWIDDVERLAEQFQTLLEQALARPEAAISTLDILSKRVRDQILIEFNNTQADTHQETCVHLLFEEQAWRTPNNTAVLDEKQQLSYAELNQRANQLAHYLQELGVGPDVLVGVSMERSTDLLISILGILKAGGAYVPLDQSYPSERLSFIMAETHMPVLLTQQHLVHRFSTTVQLVSIDTDWPEIAQRGEGNAPASCVTVANIAYVMYTSGSTGTPKGVMIPHRGLANYLAWCTEYYRVAEGSGSIVHSSIAFDLTVTALFSPLIVGRSVLLVGEDQGVEALGCALREGNNFSMVKVTPAHLGMLNAYLPVDELAGKVRTIVIGGEALLGGNLLPWQMYAPDTRLINEYGPTETVVGCCIYEVPAERKISSKVPIGRPIANTQLYILDQALQPLPMGVPGEIYIGGSGLARGYFSRPELTAERFIPNPFSIQPGMRLYKTGDLAYYLPDGTIEYLGRLDHQVKIRGYRIELEEIEAVLLLHPEVRECVVLVREDVPGEKQLVAYVGTDLRTKSFTKELHGYLGEKLPEYMLPSMFVLLDVLPLTRHGKVDRQALPIPEAIRDSHNERMRAPRTPIQEIVAAIWEKVLRIEQIGVHENFFDLGGHSLLATQIGSRLRAAFQIDITVNSIFETPTIAGLANKVEQALRGGLWPQMSPIVPVSYQQPPPLSFAQQRLWFLEQLEPGSTAYLIPSARRIHGPLDAAILEHSLDEILQRHENLRTTFQEQAGQPVQVIHPAGTFRLPLIDLCCLEPEEGEHQAQQLAKQEAQHPFDLAQGPLLRTCLLMLGAHDHVFLLTIHHIISDGWSNDVFERELVALYEAFAVGKPSPLPPLPIQYADFAIWQRQWLREEHLAMQLNYWKQQLTDAPILELPIDHPRPPLQAFEGNYQTIWLPSTLQERLIALSQQEHATLFMLLLSAFQVLLLRYSGQTDICVGTPIANRTHVELEGLIGFFVNTLVMRTDLSDNPSFLALLDRVRKVALGAYAHQELPFEHLVEALQPKRDLSHSSLFQVMFVMQQATRAVEERGGSGQQEGLTISELSIEHRVSKFDLTLYVVNEVHGLHCGIEYNIDLFEAETIQRLLGHWHCLLESIVEAPATTVADLPLLTNAERQYLFNDWNATSAQYPEGYCFHELFEAQVAHLPSAIAVVSEQSSLTYHELNQRANQLAHYLQALGVGPEVLVGVYASRSPQWIIALLAILKAGGGYVPLDPAYPPQRIAFMLADAQVSVVLTGQTLPTTCSALPVRAISLDQAWQALQQEARHEPHSSVQVENVAYVIYTSGSTGMPKGVQVTHRALGNLAQVHRRAFSILPISRVLQFSSLSFDASIWEVVMTLLTGASLHLATQEELLPGPGLLALLQERAITALTIPPSALAALPVELIPALATLMVAGEACPVEVVQRWAIGRHFWNCYGPTETTVCASIAACIADGQIPGIGTPIANTQLYVLDAHLQPVPIGIPGELYIGGITLARGYLNRPEITAERFIPHPFGALEGERLYKTGDRVRLRTDGMLEFVGRLDQQVKLRGYRIELGEIENVLKWHPLVQEAVLVLFEDNTKDRHLVAYVVANDSATKTLSSDILHSYLQEKLPNYMVPASIVLLDTLPLTPAGKIDRRALPEPEFGQHGSREGQVAPRTPIEELLAEIWHEVLKRPSINVHDNFFESGGHSLLATQLVSRLRRVFQVEVPLRSLFEAPSIAELAERVEQILRRQAKIAVPPLVRVERGQDLSLSFAQQRLWFLSQFEPESTAYLIPRALRLRGRLDTRSLERSLSEIIRRHEILRTTFQLSGSQPVQIIHPAGTYTFPVADLLGLGLEAREREAFRLASQEIESPCDLAQGPLLRISLLQLDAREYVLLFTMHHIITDGWSMEVFVRELLLLYSSFMAGQSVMLSPLSIQYVDFAAWQRQWLQGDILETQLAYWRQQLAGISPLDFPTDHSRPAIKTYHGAFQTRTMPATLRDELVSLSQREGVTLFMLLLAAFQVLLGRYTGQDDVSVGTPIANRTRAELEGLIGFFVNTLVLRTDLSNNPSFVELLSRVREVALGAYMHQDVPFEYLVEALQPERDLSRSPLFQVMFTMQQGIVTEPVQEGLAEFIVDELGVGHSTTKFDLTFFVQNGPHTLHCGIEYNTDLFEHDTIRHLLEHWQVLLEGIVATPHARLSHLPLLNGEERRLLLGGVEDTVSSEAIPQRCIQELFEQQVQITPETIALEYEEQQLTYGLLNTRANQLAHYLRRQGVGADVIVGVCLERSLDLVIALLGILKAGGVYLPLDPSSPKKRMAFMLCDAGASIILTQQSLVASVSEQGMQVFCLDDNRVSLAQEPQQNMEGSTNAELLAYVIYTSGSTGTPKGVMVSHANVVRLFAATQSDFHFSERDIWTLFHSYAFDFSVWEIWGALLYGGRLIVVSYDISRSPESFSTLLITQGVTVLNQTPSAFRQLVQVENGTAREKPFALRWIIFGGEALDQQSVRTWFEIYGEQNPQLVNMYGITETTVHVTVRPLCLHDVQHTTGSRIGHALTDLRVYVLDQYLQPVPVGVAGEMYVGGAGLARGYLNRPELTSERFLAHPFSSRAGARLYKTGDKARFLPTGELEYLGRVDQQVKIRGFRIELGEVETQLVRHPAVQSCVVMVREDIPGDRRLVAYLVAHPGVAPTSSELRLSLLETLPEYMVPVTFVLLESWPLTTGEKIDRRALPVPGLSRPVLEETYEPPRTPTEEILAMIWASVLDVERVGVHDNFFALGGDSIRSIKVLAQARKSGIHFSLQQLFRHQTIYKLSQVLGEEELKKIKVDQVQSGGLIAPEDRQRLPADVEDAYPIARLQAGMLFHSQYDPASAIYNDIISHHLQAPLDLRCMQAVLQHMVMCHPIMRTSFDLSSFSEPLQLVHREAAIPFQVEDLSRYTYEEQEALLDAWIEEVKRQHPFDWTRAPLLRIHIHIRSEQTFQFTLNCHHAILDGWSVAVLLTELFKLYLLLLDGKELPGVAPLAAQYRDFIAIEQKLLMSAEAQQYWAQVLDDSTKLTLPRWPRSDQKTEHAAFYNLPVPITPELSERLSRQARDLAVPIKSVLLAAHLKVLSVMSGETDMLFGLVYNGRPEIPDGERLLGVFVNTLPLRFKLLGGTWIDLIKDCFAAECEMLPYRWYPLAEIQRQRGEHELFKTYFDFMHFHEYKSLAGAKNLQSLGEKGFAASEFALAANFSQDLFSSQISLTVTCNLDDLCPQQIELMEGYYTSALSAIANGPHKRYDQYSLLSTKELQQMLLEWNATRVEYPADTYLHALIEDQVACIPDTVAIIFEDEQLTYAAFNQRANQVAHHLQRLGVGPESVVGVCMPRSVEMLVGLLAIFKAGGAYMPMDTSYPQERLAFMLTNAHASVLLTQQPMREQLPTYRGQEICLDTDWQTLSQESQTPPVCRVTADNLAYVIYTSGSTGQPKGVMVTQRGMLNHLFAKIQALDLTTSDRVAQTASHCFDISVWQFFAALLQGGQVCIYPDEIAHDPLQLFEQVAVGHISILEVVPSLLRAFLDVIELLPGKVDVEASLRWLVVTGEMFSATLGMCWKQRFSQVSLLNAYGPTECSDDVTHAILNQATLEGVVNAPVGKPISNTQTYILDNALEPLPVGVPGQIYVGGLGVGRGYIGDPALTASVFVPDPFGQSGGRLYKTGDIGRYHSDGQIEFIQRIDHQVKVRGYRIELGEIEAVLDQHPAVRESLVLVREDTPGDQQLVAYVVGREAGIMPSREQLRNYLLERLPHYMIPQAFVLLDAFPLTTNGKINRRALPAPESLHDEGSIVLIAARTPIEELLVGIWCEVLERSQVSVQDNFFELGGDSLLAIRLVSRVQFRLQVQVPLRSLFEAPTIVGLAQQIEQILRKGQNLELPPLRTVARQQDIPLSFAQERLWFLDQLEPGSIAYLIPNVHRFQGPLNVQVLERSLEEVIRRHESLRTTFQAREDQPVQVIHPATLFRLPVVDLSRLELGIRESETRRLIEQEALNPCDLTRGPLLRLFLVRLHCDEQVLLWTMHHIISDRWSMQVFEREMVTLYQAFACGQSSPLPPLPIQYADFAFWQRQWLQGEVLEAQIDYWVAQLSGAPTLELPIDHPRPPVQSRRGADHFFILSGELSQALVTLSQREGVTLFMILLAAFQVLLYRYTGQRDFVLGTNSANRNRVEVEGMIGFFVNLLALRAHLSGNPSFGEVLHHVRELVLGAYAHQETPFELVVERLALTRTLDRMPLVQALFVLQNFSHLQSTQREMTDFTEQELILDPLKTEAATARFDLALFMAEHTTGQLFGGLNYSLDLFESSTIATMAARFKALLQSVVHNPDEAIDRLEFLTDQERLQNEQEIEAIKSKLRLRKGERFTLPG